MSKNQTKFIEFLVNEFGGRTNFYDSAKNNSQGRQNVILKKQIYKSTKLQKVLDIFIEEEKKHPSKVIDNVLVEAWQSATEKEKEKIVSSFVKKQKINKNGIKEIIDFISKGPYKLEVGEHKNSLKEWKTNLVTLFLFVFVFSVILGRFFPDFTDQVNSYTKKIVYQPLYSKIYLPQAPRPPMSIPQIVVKKEDLSEFIRRNHQGINIPKDKNTYTINLSPEDIIGQVAGVSEENEKGIQPNIASKTKPFNFKEKLLTLANNFGNKQIEIVEKINKKLIAIFEK